MVLTMAMTKAKNRWLKYTTTTKIPIPAIDTYCIVLTFNTVVVIVVFIRTISNYQYIAFIPLSDIYHITLSPKESKYRDTVTVVASKYFITHVDTIWHPNYNSFYQNIIQWLLGYFVGIIICCTGMWRYVYTIIQLCGNEKGPWYAIRRWLFL